MLSGEIVILILKIAVIAVTCLFLASLVALARGKYRLHGRINTVFFILTVTALLGLELLVRLIKPDIFDYFDDATRKKLLIHLCFSLPSAAILPIMLITGLKHLRLIHILLACIFSVLWTGTFITGVFFLPHTRL